MKNFKVLVQEDIRRVSYYLYEVEAENENDAIDKVSAGKYKNYEQIETKNTRDSRQITFLSVDKV